MTLYTRATKLDKDLHAAFLPTNTRLAKSLEATLENTSKNNIPPISVSALQGQYLAIQAQLIGAKTILEVGTLGGYSTIWFASTGAHITCLEIDPHHKKVALENIANAGYADNVDIILGDARETMPALKAEGKKFDMVFIDADWDFQWEFFEHAVGLVRPGGCIYTDNVVREVLEGGVYEKGQKEPLYVKVGRLEGVQATVVPVVSTWKENEEEMLDGFLLAVVKG